MSRFLIYGCFFIVFIACKKENKTKETEVILSQEVKTDDESTQQVNYQSLFKENVEYISNGFDFPVGKPNANGYYNAQKFQDNYHLGDDWNGVGGGNSDLGDNIYSVSNGYVSEVKDYEGGWGNVIRIVHLHKNKLYESLYAHCDTMIIKEGSFINKGDKIATIGNCNGTYLAHLHLEIRDSINSDIGPGYSDITDGYLDPTLFIKNNRN